MAHQHLDSGSLSAQKFPVLRSEGQIYLDYNATTPMASELVAKSQEWLSAWGNPSSIHWAGREPKARVRNARRFLSEALGCHFLELVFTSSGSEANNLGLKGFFHGARASQLFDQKRNKYITTTIEHPSVSRTFDWLKTQGAEVHRVPVDREGQLDWQTYEGLVDERTALVSCIFASNETGSLLPVKKMAKLAHSFGAFVHTDAVQALGKVPLNLSSLGVDFASFSAHKFYSLRGAGALYVKKGSPFVSEILGGSQERGRRAGTENTLAITSFGEMAKYLPKVIDFAPQLAELRDGLQKSILHEIPGVRVNGSGVRRVPNTLSLTIDDVEGESLLMALDLKGIAVSTGAACSSGSPEPSESLLAMGLSPTEARSSLRVSLGWGTQRSEIEKFVEILKSVVARLREVVSSKDDLQVSP